jgi:hypothetical protein
MIRASVSFSAQVRSHHTFQKPMGAKFYMHKVVPLWSRHSATSEF